VLQVAAAALLYSGLVLGALLADAVLHRAGLREVGKWAGPAGTALILLGSLHSARRRAFITWPSVRHLLSLHEVLGWLGTLLILVHAGVHFEAIVPWLAVGMILIVVASGFVGRHLLARARASANLRSRSTGDAELLDLLMVEALKRWRAVHLPLTAALAALVVVHVAAELLLWP
jgi:hypothetical protein